MMFDVLRYEIEFCDVLGGSKSSKGTSQKTKDTIVQTMGLCASKADQSSSAPPVAPSRASKRKSRGLPKKANPKQDTRPQAGASAVKTSDGHRINDEVDETKDKLSAQEAARLAAEKRLQEANEKSTRGALGKKLAEERSKSHKTHMMKEVEKRQVEQANKELVYD